MLIRCIWGTQPSPLLLHPHLSVEFSWILSSDTGNRETKARVDGATRQLSQAFRGAQTKVQQ